MLADITKILCQWQCEPPATRRAPEDVALAIGTLINQRQMQPTPHPLMRDFNGHQLFRFVDTGPMPPMNLQDECGT